VFYPRSQDLQAQLGIFGCRVAQCVQRRPRARLISGYHEGVQDLNNPRSGRTNKW